MKCSNCGAQYKTRELRCPYCGTENLMGHIWMAQRSEAELEYERTRKEVGKKGSIYVLNRVVNRTLIILTLLLVLMMGIAMLVFFTSDFFGDAKRKIKGDEMQATMQQYYDEKNYEQLYHYMEENGLFSEERYQFTQAAVLYDHFAGYTNRKIHLYTMTKEDLAGDKQYELVQLLVDSMEIYRADIGIYDEPIPENEEQYEMYRIDIQSFWRGSLGLTDAEVEKLVNAESHLYRDVAVSLVDDILEREAWK